MSKYVPDPQLVNLGNSFADAVEPANFPQTMLRYRNTEWAQKVGLGGLSQTAWIEHFARFHILPENQPEPLAMRYHGHQFQTYNPDIGDGRGFLFAQLRDDTGRLLDLGTKGSGQTPYSRFGDGRLTLKGGVREVLASAYLEAHGVYASKIFSLIETGEELERGDEPSPTRSAVMVRLQHSHVRFGMFQRFAYLNEPDNISKLVEHCVELYHPQAKRAERGDQAAAFLEEVVSATAIMVASWMAAGFVHGVMNTDNMNVTGETFDFGPYRFLPYSDPNFTAAYFDQNGLYRFGRQPTVGLWNLQQLAGTLTLIAETEPLERALASYEQVYQRALRDRSFAQLGLIPTDLRDDLQVLQTLFSWMTETRVNWPQFYFDWFCGVESEARASKSPMAYLYNQPAFSQVREQLLSRTPDRVERLNDQYFCEVQPASLLIEDIEALWSRIADDDDWSAFETKMHHIARAKKALDLSPAPTIQVK